jgi:hypothetical protein
MKVVFLSIVIWFTCIKSLPAQRDEIRFKGMLKAFNAAIRANNLEQMSTMIKFPLPTNVSSQDLENGVPIDHISKQDFKKYYAYIFHPKVVKLVPLSKYDGICEVTSSNGNYYAILKKLIDKGSKMYELYIQYPEDQSKAESYFSFVFGQVSGQYRVIGYYAKWPVSILIHVRK